MKKRVLVALLGLAGLASAPAQALNIVLSNDDGLTSNVKALYEALKQQGHDVIVSVPCTGQSMRSGGTVMYSSGKTLSAADDSVLARNKGCHNGALKINDMDNITEAPVGTFNKAGFTNGDWNYVHGTPVMATMYGLDVLAQNRWGKAPDLVLSGPNEGWNPGTLTLVSGTVGNVQFAATRGIPAIALSGAEDTADDEGLAHPSSPLIASLTVKLLQLLQQQPSAKAGGALLPPGMMLNVNFPREMQAGMPLTFAKQGTWNIYRLNFNSYSDSSPYYGIGGERATTRADATQQEDEPWVASSGKVAVSAMQMAFDARPAAQEWLRLRLSEQSSSGRSQ